MENITITLDGREVSGHRGMTVLELARESNIYIPTLCDDEHLTPIGACRICLVEDERTGKFLASCVTPISSGMVVNTQSPKVLKHRRTIIKLLLASHPDSCLVCDKGNWCQLRKIATDLGIGRIDFQHLPNWTAVEDVNTFIERDLSKCILCAKCIRACQELVVVGAIDYYLRGFATRPATFNDQPLESSECTFCGTCVAMCPTGALMEKVKTYRGAAGKSVSTTCPLCGCGCSISLEIKDDKVIRVRPLDGVNKGTLCVRGSYGLNFVHSRNRLTKPLIKQNNGFEEVSWDEALGMVASRFSKLEEYNPSSLAVLGGTRCTTEENYLLQRFARCTLGTNNIDSDNRLFRTGLLNKDDYFDSDSIEHADVIIVIGGDPSCSSPIVEYKIKRAVKYNHTQLILIDPRQTKLSAFAQLQLHPRIGSDVALLNALANVIITESAVVSGIRDHKGFRDLTKILGEYPPQTVEEITGITADNVFRLARLLASAKNLVIIYGTGVTQHIDGLDRLRAINNLIVLTGNQGKIFALQRESNSRGAIKMGITPNLLPGYQSTTNPAIRNKFEEAWGVKLPTMAGLTAMEIIQQAKAGNIRGLYIVGENPAKSYPNSTLVQEALQALDFLVVQDMFHTESAQLADVVLPVTSFAEKEGTFINFEGRVGLLQKAIECVGDSQPDWQIILQLAQKMGRPFPFTSLQEVRDEMERWVTSSHGIDNVQLWAVKYQPRQVDLDFPLALLTGINLFGIGTSTRSDKSLLLKGFSDQHAIEINGVDFQELELIEDEEIKIVSPVGSIRAVAKENSLLPKGVLFMAGSTVNRLLDIDLNPESKSPVMKVCHVRLEKV